MRRWFHFIFLILAASGFAYGPEPEDVAPIALILRDHGSNPDIVTTNLSYLFVPASATTLSYDPDGNLTNDGHFSYVWNSENQLTSIASLTNTPAESKRKLTFDYDALGRRIRAGVSRWTNSTWLVTSSNKFLYDGWNLVAELNATNNNLIRAYAWGLDLSASMDNDGGGVGGLLWVNDASTLGSNSTHFVSYDGNGNVTALVDAGSGNETARYEYGPFGDLTQASGLMARANQIRFSSKYHDDYTGLIYYGYRYYSSTFQRWLNRDPLSEEGGLNLYGFVDNDPINATDALGLISSLHFVPASELAWMLGGSAAIDTALSVGMQKLTADPCKDKWLDWGKVGTEVGTGTLLTAGTLGMSKLYDVYQAAKLARLLRHADDLRELGRYDDLAEMVALHGDEFGNALVASRRANVVARGTATPSAGFAINQGRVKRTVEEAKALAKQYGIHVPSDIHFEVQAVRKMQIASDGRRVRAEYAQLGDPSSVKWSDFYNRDGMIPVRLKSSVLLSDEAIVATITHEMHELNTLRELFAHSGGVMSNKRLGQLINEPTGYLHLEALKLEQQIVRAMRGQR